MASIKLIPGSPMGAFRHDLRERKRYNNPDIDQRKRESNYMLHPINAVVTSRELYKKYRKIIDQAYCRGGKTAHAFEVVIQRPDGLALEKERDFFESMQEFIVQKVLAGDRSHHLLSVVHCDEIGRNHIHFIGVFPEIVNEKYLTINKKLDQGILKSDKQLGIRIKEEDIPALKTALQRYEMSDDSDRERGAIHDFQIVLGVTRDEARAVFTRCRRLESERFQYRLMSAEEALSEQNTGISGGKSKGSKGFYEGFHPALQAWVDEYGPDCSVYHGGKGMALSVDRLKSFTNDTGLTVDKLEEIQKNTGCVLVKKELFEKYEREHQRQAERNWGQEDNSAWGEGGKTTWGR